MRPFGVLALLAMSSVVHAAYVLDPSKATHTFDGIGGISGGGATSRLLPSYPAKQRNEILDFLFLPKFGAALQILKVEIGGDAQSTDGGESSHMHTADDLNYKRGYEWWLMQEAKRRNPAIKLYGLPWAFPGWVGTGDNPYAHIELTASYVTKWVQGAKSVYNLDIDYIGIWNERNYNIDYIKLLRKSLNDAGFTKTQIVAADGDWGIASDVLKDAELRDAVDILGAHYPGTESSEQAKQTGKRLWASEDYSTYNDMTGGGCWTRILNQNYVNGLMTSTISWNLIAAYYPELPYGKDGLMNANHPWTGHYDVMSPIWGSAHTTQFTEIGWKYLDVGSGSGKLDHGGSYVTFYDPKNGNLTIVIEKMSAEHSVCIRPHLNPFTTADEIANFELTGSLAGISSLSLWYSHYTFSDLENPVWFEEQKRVQVVNGKFSLNVTVNSMYTLSTTSGQRKGVVANIPEPSPFPEHYSDNFDSYPEFSEANYFADQAGIFEIRKAADVSRGMVMRQVVPTRPIRWSHDFAPHSVIGDNSWTDIVVEVDGLIEASTGGVVIGGRTSGDVNNMNGIYWAVYADGQWTVDTITSGIIYGPHEARGSGLTIGVNTWHKYRIEIYNDSISLLLDDKVVHLNVTINRPPLHGWASIGTPRFDFVQFDNFSVTKYSKPCVEAKADRQVEMIECVSREKFHRTTWKLSQDGLLSLRDVPNLCISAQGTSLAQPVILKACDASDASQVVVYKADTHEIVLKSNNKCLDIFGASRSLGEAVDFYPCNGQDNQDFTFDEATGNVYSFSDELCMGTC